MNRNEFYRRNLPHLQPIGGTFFVTYMLYGAIPRPLYEKWEREHEAQLRHLEEQLELGLLSASYPEAIDRLQKKFFVIQDEYLKDRRDGTFYLKEDKVAKVVADSLHFWDKKRIDLICFSIMPNHVHAVFRTMLPQELDGVKVVLNEILHSVKRHSANKCNKLLNKNGPFWNDESYDRLVRSKKELARIIQYTLNNPVKAGFCLSPGDWKWNYISPEYNEFI